MFLFYAEGFDGSLFYLEEGEAIHCGQVLRKSLGDQIYFTDGAGQAFRGEIVIKEKKRIGLEVLENIALTEERDYRIHIAIAPTKNINRFEWFLEKATELGIDEITPIICEHSERKNIKPERSEKILVSAMKQSLKTRRPQLNPQSAFKKFIKSNFPTNRFIAHLEEETVYLINGYQKGHDVLVLIGPEGGFSENEVSQAKNLGFESVSLGDYRLRTETAGISAVQSIHFVNQAK